MAYSLLKNFLQNIYISANENIILNIYKKMKKKLKESIDDIIKTTARIFKRGLLHINN